MNKDWDYANMVHDAHEGGGPEKYIRDIEEYNYNEGVKDGKHEQLIGDLLFTCVCAGGAALIGYLVGHRKNKNESQITKEQAIEARENLIIEASKVSDSDKNNDTTSTLEEGEENDLTE